LSFSLGFVFEVSILEFGAYIDGYLEFLIGFLSFIRLDQRKNSLTGGKISGFRNNCVANFSDEHNKSWGSLIEFRVIPNKKNGMHNRNKKFMKSHEVFSGVF